MVSFPHFNPIKSNLIYGNFPVFFLNFPLSASYRNVQRK